jgi:hypothetical protein
MAGRLEGIKEGVEMFLPDYLHDLNAGNFQNYEQLP